MSKDVKCLITDEPSLKLIAHVNVNFCFRSRVISLKYFFQCSYSMCLKTEEQNKKAVKEYEEQWRARNAEQFDCFYSTSNLEHAILEKMHTKEDVLHSMLWPSLVIVVCGIIFLRLEMKRRNITCCKSQSNNEDNVEQGKRSRTGSFDPSAESLLSPSRNGGVPGSSEKNTLLRYTPEIKGPTIECSLAPHTYLDKTLNTFLVRCPHWIA